MDRHPVTRRYERRPLPSPRQPWRALLLAGLIALLVPAQGAFAGEPARPPPATEAAESAEELEFHRRPRHPQPAAR